MVDWRRACGPALVHIDTINTASTVNVCANVGQHVLHYIQYTMVDGAQGLRVLVSVPLDCVNL